MGPEEGWEACACSQGPSLLAAESLLGSVICLFGSSLIQLSPKCSCALPPRPTLVISGLVPPCWKGALSCWGIQGPSRAWGQAWTSMLGTPPARVEPGLLLPCRGVFQQKAGPPVTGIPLCPPALTKDHPLLYPGSRVEHTCMSPAPEGLKQHPAHASSSSCHHPAESPAWAQDGDCPSFC